MSEEIKVSDLPVASYINDSDLLMIVQGQANKQMTKEILQNAILDSIQIDKQVQEYLLVGLAADSNLIGAKVVPFDTIKKSASSRLTLDTTNNCITIGSGVAEVEVSAMVFFEDLNDNPLYAWCDIRKNGTAVITSIADTSTNYGTVPFVSFPIEVTTDDRIDIYKKVAATQKVRGSTSTYLMVKVTKEV